MCAWLVRVVSRITSADCFSLLIWDVLTSTFAFEFNLYRYKKAQPYPVVHRRHLVLRRRGGGALHRGPVQLGQALPRPHGRRLEAILRVPAAARGGAVQLGFT
jgi:hypothetical protein